MNYLDIGAKLLELHVNAMHVSYKHVYTYKSRKIEYMLMDDTVLEHIMSSSYEQK